MLHRLRKASGVRNDTLEPLQYKLSQIRPDSIMVEIAVPGERWEVEFFNDGHLEVETFLANPTGIEDEEAIKRLFDNFSD